METFFNIKLMLEHHIHHLSHCQYWRQLPIIHQSLWENGAAPHLWHFAQIRQLWCFKSPKAWAILVIYWQFRQLSLRSQLWPKIPFIRLITYPVSHPLLPWQLLKSRYQVSLWITIKLQWMMSSLTLLSHSVPECIVETIWWSLWVMSLLETTKQTSHAL